jgi:hypothetical protein
MPKITEEELVPIQVRLFKADHNKLTALYSRDVGVNAAIRTIIRSYLRQVDAKAAAEIDKLEAKS